MKSVLEINNQADSPIEDSLLDRAVSLALDFSGLDFSDKGSLTISLAWISEEEIRKLNAEYRNNDSVTDVLSFPEFSGKEDFDKAKGELFLGEIVLCYNCIKEYAEKNDYPEAVKREIANVTAHGVLHLLGFDHGQEMFSIQERVTGEIFKN